MLLRWTVNVHLWNEYTKIRPWQYVFWLIISACRSLGTFWKRWQSEVPLWGQWLKKLNTFCKVYFWRGVAFKLHCGWFCRGHPCVLVYLKIVIFVTTQRKIFKDHACLSNYRRSSYCNTTTKSTPLSKISILEECSAYPSAIISIQVEPIKG